jgi:hypothetical protein
LNIITGADEEDGGEEVAVDNAENEVPGDGLWPAVVLGSPNILLRISAEIMKIIKRGKKGLKRDLKENHQRNWKSGSRGFKEK